jgi:glycine betaine/choline ABC-type transport system substrate-binding protein
MLEFRWVKHGKYYQRFKSAITCSYKTINRAKCITNPRQILGRIYNKVEMSTMQHLNKEIRVHHKHNTVYISHVFNNLPLSK